MLGLFFVPTIEINERITSFIFKVSFHFATFVDANKFAVK